MISGETGISFPKVTNILVREGLIKLGRIEESTSQACLLVKTPLEPPQPPTAGQRKAEEVLKKKNEYFKNVLKQWDLDRSEEWKAKIFTEAEKYKDELEAARLLLARKEGAT